VHLQGGFPRLREGTLALLGCEDDAGSIAAAVRGWDAQALEDALAEHGMCGAMARTAEEWARHPQGQALARLPAVEVIKVAAGAPEPLVSGDAPLSGVRVLDLTRVLAGPSCGRTLAQHGAEVLHIAAPHVPTLELFEIDTGHGKRSAWADLDTPAGVEALRGLARGCDVFVNGYREGALARKGFGPNDVAALRPGAIYVSINCYGHAGPWSGRRGWEQLAQTATGIAVEHGSVERPVLIPAAPCDYTTGYLAAWGVMRALSRRATEGGSYHVRASLAQTAMWIGRLGRCDAAQGAGVGDVSAFMIETETPYGRVSHLRPAVEMGVTPAVWSRATVPLGTDAAEWVG
jgi:hypothetical protein